jgi:hypothetical protein
VKITAVVSSETRLFMGLRSSIPPGYSSSVMLCHLSAATMRCSQRKYIESATDGGVNGKGSETWVC